MSTKLFTHYSRDENLVIKNEPKEHCIKPRGLWLAKGDEWLKACNKMGMGCAKYKYEIIVDMTDIIVIDSVEKLIEFTQTYRLNFFSIDWAKVFSTYKGIFINNYKMIKSSMMFTDVLRGFEYTWFLGCDISSCCIVDTSCIVSYSKCADQPHKIFSSDGEDVECDDKDDRESD